MRPRLMARPTAIVVALILLAACGRPFGAVATVEQERQLGEESLPVLINAMGGIYADRALRQYVQGLTDELAATVELAEGYEPLRVEILDTEMPSAYAGAGGAIFVTRGLLGMVTTEAELAGVIAHEIGHVLKRHVALGIAARERQVKDVVDEQQPRLRQIRSRSTQMSIIRAELEKRLPDAAEFSRAQELEADQLALQMLTAKGYPTSGFKDLLVRVSTLQARKLDAIGVSSERIASYRQRSSYPKLADRVAALGSLRSGEPDPDGQERLMKMINGMIFDNIYDGGVIKGGVYRNERYGLGFDVEEEVLTDHSRGLQIATADEMVIVRFDRPNDRSLDDIMEISEFGQLTFENQQRVDINGLSALTAEIRSTREDVDTTARLTVLDLGRVFATLIGVVGESEGADAGEDDRALYNGIVGSIRKVPKSGVPDVRRYRTRKVEAGDTVAALAAETTFDGDKEAALRLWNGLGPDDDLEVGQWIKLVK